MIHDVLLSCLNLYSKNLPIEEFLVSDAVSTFLHPCEKKILQDIIGIVNLLRESAKFSRIYGSNNFSLSFSIDDTDEPLQNGLYLKAFANGIDTVLQDYFVGVSELERRYLQNPSQSLLFIYHKLQVYEPLAMFLRKLIRGIRLQKLHGCAMIQFLHQNMPHGDRRIYRAMRIIQASVNVMFLKQLTNWILYAKIVDTFDEFFIQSSEIRNNTTPETDNCTSSDKHNLTTLPDCARSTYADIWCFEIVYDFLPYYLSPSWAEKVMFIGQTVIIFRRDANKRNKTAWNKPEHTFLDGDDSLWNENEHTFFSNIQALQMSDDEVNVAHYERVIDEIKQFVTTRLSEIAINQADLVHQMKLIKDFYLFGRGELFLEFIRQTYGINKFGDIENKMRDYVKAFESAAHSVGISEDVDKFTLSFLKPIEGEEVNSEFGYLPYVQLLYKINWPLHLLFSPKVIERYNILFRFLLLIKKIQYDLHQIWCTQTRTSKLKKSNTVKVLHVRNQLMFIIDNLQYYIQVDVLESQFSILLNTILNRADFEQIQRSHTIFLANVLSLCFLLSNEDATKMSMTQSTTVLQVNNNPVYIILNDIFHMCDDFCSLLNSTRSDEEINIEVNKYDVGLCVLVDQLINLLVDLKVSANITPLSQLLLRLDFNHWFSSKKITQKI